MDDSTTCRSFTAGACGHACRCQCVCEAATFSGIAVRSSSPTVGPVLQQVFPGRGADGDVIIVTEQELPGLKALVEGFTAMDQRATRAAIVRPDGTFDPWSAGPVEMVLRRIETPWFPAMMNAQQVRFDFQPIVDAETGRVHGNEALVRSAMPGLDLNPGELIEAARAHDAILTFDQVCRTMAIRSGASAVSDDGDEPGDTGRRLFINFMPLTIYDPAVCLRTTFAAAAAVGIASDRLVFEVVESEAFPDIEHLKKILAAYRERGTKVALDDVGSGNTAVKFIDDLMPDYVKLDREILQRAVATGGTAMYTGLTRHCLEHEITVIAEGIETQAELDFCRSIGVELVQGYLIQRPAAEPLIEAVSMPVTGSGAGEGDAGEDEGEGEGDRFRLPRAA